MKKNELVPVGNGESFTRCGWIRLALKTLFEDPHASFFVETIPLCVQLNLIVLLRLAIVGAFSLEIPRLFAVILGLFITTLIYSTSVAAKLWFLSPTRLQKIGVVIILCGGLSIKAIASRRQWYYMAAGRYFKVRTFCNKLLQSLNCFASLPLLCVHRPYPAVRPEPHL